MVNESYFFCLASPWNRKWLQDLAQEPPGCPRTSNFYICSQILIIFSYDFSLCVGFGTVAGRPKAIGLFDFGGIQKTCVPKSSLLSALAQGPTLTYSRHPGCLSSAGVVQAGVGPDHPVDARQQPDAETRCPPQSHRRQARRQKLDRREWIAQRPSTPRRQTQPGRGNRGYFLPGYDTGP